MQGQSKPYGLGYIGIFLTPHGHVFYAGRSMGNFVPMNPTFIGMPLRFQRWGFLSIASVLTFAFATGGGASDHGYGDAATQWLSLLVLAWALLALSQLSGSTLRRIALSIAGLIVFTVMLQQLPLPEQLWNCIAVRETLADDLRAAGVTSPLPAWSLSPLASERGLWALLPALAVFTGVLATPISQHRRLVLLVVWLTATSLLLGYLQLGAPQDSILNPFPEWPPALNGLFSNPNHQATALGISLVIVTSLLIEDYSRPDGPELTRGWRLGLIVLSVLMMASLPMTGSRAMLLLALLGLIAVPFLLRVWRRGPNRTRRGRVWLTRSVLSLLALGVVASAVGWLRYDISEEVRVSVAKATIGMGNSHAPWGAGIGSFVPWFQQTAPMHLLQGAYFNHAHNEYAQWWLESGLMGLLCLLGVSMMLVICFPRRTEQGHGHEIAVAAWLGCMLLLLHSSVDYPLRTPTLMTVGALLAGIVVANKLQLQANRRVAGVHPPQHPAA